jgi:hypothetical protein
LGGRVARKTQVSRRYLQLRKTFKTDIEKTRTKTNGQLEELFRFASAFARGNIQFTYAAGKREKVTLPQRKRWLLVAGCIVQIMKANANGIDERKVEADLDKLGLLINAACETSKT